MDLFKMLKQAKEMQSQMKKIQEELKGKTVEVNSGGINIIINGKQEILSVKVPPEILQNATGEKLEKILLRGFNDAISQSQALMANEMKKISGGLNIPGLS